MMVFVPLCFVGGKNCKNALTCHVLYVNDQQYFLSDQTMQTNPGLRMWSLCSANITYQQHQQMYLHVFIPHISIRTHRHKHPHYVLMCNNIFVWVPSSDETNNLHAGDNGTIFQASGLPVGDTATTWQGEQGGREGGRDGQFSSCIPASQAACSSFLPPLCATPNHRDAGGDVFGWLRWFSCCGWLGFDRLCN